MTTVAIATNAVNVTFLEDAMKKKNLRVAISSSVRSPNSYFAPPCLAGGIRKIKEQRKGIRSGSRPGAKHHQQQLILCYPGLLPSSSSRLSPPSLALAASLALPSASRRFFSSSSSCFACCSSFLDVEPQGPE